MQKNTKIVCTLGPSSDSISEIESLVNSGMDLARLNFSHGTYENHKKILDNLRTVEKRTGKTIGVIQDIQGPKIRVGTIPDPGIIIKRGEKIKLSITEEKVRKTKTEIIIPIQYKNIIKDTKKGDIILIDDGLLELIINNKNRNELICTVRIGGLVKSHKGVNVPTGSISAKAITEKDMEDIKWGLKQNVDYIALSFVKSAKDIEELRDIIKKNKKNTKIIAKVERHEAIKNLEEIIKASDAVMVARGDLGIEIPAEMVPLIQKEMIKLSNKYQKPVITATQVLQSMVENSRATRAEISDAANAIFDHTDAIMLSNESAVGKYAQRAVKTLKDISITVEHELQKHEHLMKWKDHEEYISEVSPICRSACQIAIESKAKLIAVYTESGFMAREIAKNRLYIPIITITPNNYVKRELTLVWGLNKIIQHKIDNKQNKLDEIINVLKKEKLIKTKDKIVIVYSSSIKEKLISTYIV